MRIAHVITRLIVGGAQENTIATVLGLLKWPELHVRLISGPTTGPEGSLENMFDGRPDLLRIVPSLVRPVHPLQDFRALFALTNAFRDFRPDIVHTHSGKAGIIGRFAAKRAKVPIIIHTIHGPSFGAWQGAIGNILFRNAERAAARVTSHFITVANAMTEQYLRAGIARPEMYTRIFSGFPLGPFLKAANDLQLRARYGLAPDDIVAGKIARMFKLKGHDDLFKAAPAIVKAVPRIKFLLVGGGQWEERFRAWAKEMALQDHFVFTGLVPPAEIPPLIGIMDLLVHLSLREGLPRALPQALAGARPVVAYDCDGASEVCLPGKTGFLIAPHDTAAFTDAVCTLAKDNDLRMKLGREGQQFVKENFSVEGMIAAIEKLYLRLSRGE